VSKSGEYHTTEHNSFTVVDLRLVSSIRQYIYSICNMAVFKKIRVRCEAGMRDSIITCCSFQENV
jgi:hypothetical protein